MSNLAITGLYFFNSEVVSKARKLIPSKRGELEIVDLIKSYHEDEKLSFTQLPSGTAWLDTGTPEGLHDATSYVRIIEERTSIKIACLEEIAFRKGWIDRLKLSSGLDGRTKNSYSVYLKKLLESGQ
jgi:glucose-1-phosphate thymidylyltransferase